MPEQNRTSYDDVPYSSYPYRQSHPERLATIATLFGMQPPPLERCRVLELGCSMGGNLIPVAERFPESAFLGIDASSRQIAEGQAALRALELKNITLAHRSIMDVSAEDGAFDYVLCHGVYSWVPEEVQQKILAICRQNLSPNGVAYVSYNTYRCWHMRGMIRDMMLYRTRECGKPGERVRQARALLDFSGPIRAWGRQPVWHSAHEGAEPAAGQGRFVSPARAPGRAQFAGVLPPVHGAGGVARPAIPGRGGLQRDVDPQLSAAGRVDAAERLVEPGADRAVHGLRAKPDVPPDAVVPQGSQPRSLAVSGPRAPAACRLVGQARAGRGRPAFAHANGLSRSQRRDDDDRAAGQSRPGCNSPSSGPGACPSRSCWRWRARG